MPSSNQRALIKRTARNLRKRQTQSEALFWEAVRDRRFQGMKFLRQHPLRFRYQDGQRFFITDFYCPEHKLVIEIDGKIHEEQAERDELRTWIINHIGLRVLRFTNDDLQDLQFVLDKITKEFAPRM